MADSDGDAAEDDYDSDFQDEAEDDSEEDAEKNEAEQSGQDDPNTGFVSATYATPSRTVSVTTAIVSESMPLWQGPSEGSEATLAEIPPHLLGGSLLCLEEGTLGRAGSKMTVTAQEEARLYVVVEVPAPGPSTPGSAHGALAAAFAHSCRWLSEGEETPTWKRPVPEGAKRPARPDLLMFSTLLQPGTTITLPEVQMDGYLQRAFAVAVKVATLSIGITVSSSSDLKYERTALVEEGVTPWLDRDHKYLDVPAYLKGGILYQGPFKDVPGDTILEVKTNASARVYVITERRSGQKGHPSWVEQLEAAGWNAEEPAPRWHDMATMRCLGRMCPAGWTLTLPPCHAPPGEGPVFSLVVVPCAGQLSAPLEANCVYSDGENAAACSAVVFGAPESASLGRGELLEVPLWMRSPEATLVWAGTDVSEASGAHRFTLRAAAPSVIYALLPKSASISSAWADDGWEPRDEAPSYYIQGEEEPPKPMLVLAKRSQARQLVCAPPTADRSAGGEVLALVVKVDVEAFDAHAECSNGLELLGTPVKEAGLLWTDRQNRMAFIPSCMRSGLVLRGPHELRTRPGLLLRLRASRACRIYVGVEASYGSERPRNGGGLAELLLSLGWTAESVKEVSAPAWGDKTSNMQMLSRRLTEGQELEMPLRGRTSAEEAPLLMLLVVVSIEGVESLGKELKRSFAAWASEDSGLSAEALSTLLRVLCPHGSEAEQQTVVAETMAATAGPLRKVVSPDEFVEKLLLFGSEADRREAAER